MKRKIKGEGRCEGSIKKKNSPKRECWKFGLLEIWKMKCSTKENKTSFQKRTRKGTNEITKRKNTPKKRVLEVRTTGNLENEVLNEGK
jgi:hypothetical protein